MTQVTASHLERLPVREDEHAWHEPGIFIARSPEGELVLETIAESAYSARAALLRAAPFTWSSAVEKGYSIISLAPVGVVLDKRYLAKA